jgi:hypothetical protein
MAPATLALKLVGTATSYKMDGPRLEYRQGQKILSFLQPPIATLRPTQPRVQSVPQLFPLLKRPGRDVDHSSPSSTKVKNERSCASFYPAYLHGVDKDEFIFQFTVKEGWYVQVHASHSTGLYILVTCVIRSSLSVAENPALDKGRWLWSICVCFRPNCFDSPRHVLEEMNIWIFINVVFFSSVFK